ncbi:MAG: glycine cleavage system aminomethyltransferase GcvT [Geminocystis sp.]|nr:glycine cleavage system aminomethyltransferase GcvT [Geminocystis sp.]HIK38487.1 glycine cleavage system aminomethyltransferase GcvT [Geminocystis sp. M7585_C2015_104]MCS7147560.1 glycine cleavage system aminomethyltransferase GcvT [Geminocystis sp.]MCX8077963.1 glycine cleavage system aminomethyltransferase GcvT [Geminocystis sp.]MDW8115253.1 glycine cleavage system aminomethyltransferase GcvT [Geminocystis sp.]
MTVSYSKPSRTPLYPLLAKIEGVKFTSFAGWEMPLQFTGVKNEHLAVREEVGMFDISHMGKFFFKGERLREKFGRLTPTNLTNLKAGKAKYTVLLNPQGGIVDDVIFYYLGEENGRESGILIVNAATREKDFAWLQTHLAPQGVTLEDKTLDLVLIALQGRNAINVLSKLVEADLGALEGFSHTYSSLCGENVFIARTGYTGEDGFEIMTSGETGRQLWQYCIVKGVTPCGLGARDTLRLEAGMCLYGQDINENTTPLEAGLGWLVDFNHDFIGKEALLRQKQEGVKRKLVGLTMDGRHIPRHGYSLVVDNNAVGFVTSGTFSPTLQRGIALAYIDSCYSKVGQKVMVEIRGKLNPATVVRKPFYRRGY